VPPLSPDGVGWPKRPGSGAGRARGRAARCDRGSGWRVLDHRRGGIGKTALAVMRPPLLGAKSKEWPTGARGLRQFERRPLPSERRCASPQIHIRGPQLRGVLVSSRPALRDAARSFFPKPISFRHDSAGICILTLSLQVEISRCSYIISKGDDVSRPGSVGERRPPTIVSSTHGLRPIINGITLLA
jgi:hypothetical protein